MEKALSLAFAAFVALGLRAEAQTVNGVSWICRVVGGAAEIYDSGATAVGGKTSGPVPIPSKLGGRSVAGIGDGAF
ncbi:MAG: hypothetical protein J6T01_02540 [Kiritimatiellae bacterium]|nr:hypothetical protein [Kiritimatiellia bacterium]